MLSFGRIVALASFIFTLGTIALTYYLGTKHGFSPLCNPFLEGCTDITHTGMQGSAGMVFRAGLIIGCVFILLWWSCMSVWLKPYASNVARYSMWFFGLLSISGLIVGTAVLLPNSDDIPWFVHIKGANLFFQASLFAFMINYRLVYVRHTRHQPVPSFRLKTVLFILMMTTSLAFAALGIEEYMSDGVIILEWWGSTFIGLYYLTSFWDWKNLRLSVVS